MIVWLVSEGFNSFVLVILCGFFGMFLAFGVVYYRMRLIIAGSRSITDRSVVEDAIEESPFELSEVDVLLNGDADGVDSIAKTVIGEVSEECEDVDISVELYLPEEYVDEAPNERVAPLFRNTAMAEDGDALLAIWDGSSSGTEDMISKAKREGLVVDVFRTDTSSLTDFM